MDVRSLEITGSTDRAGSTEYNLLLSRRRAEGVRDALLARGMSPRIQVSIVANGETQPLNQTRDGVADAQNRHVVILPVSMCVQVNGERFGSPSCRTPRAD